jgi:hypothetical protein
MTGKGEKKARRQHGVDTEKRVFYSNKRIMFQRFPVSLFPF